MHQSSLCLDPNPSSVPISFLSSRDRRSPNPFSFLHRIVVCARLCPVFPLLALCSPLLSLLSTLIAANIYSMERERIFSSIHPMGWEQMWKSKWVEVHALSVWEMASSAETRNKRGGPEPPAECVAEFEIGIRELRSFVPRMPTC